MSIQPICVKYGRYAKLMQNVSRSNTWENGNRETKYFAYLTQSILSSYELHRSSRCIIRPLSSSSSSVSHNLQSGTMQPSHRAINSEEREGEGSQLWKQHWSWERPTEDWGCGCVLRPNGKATTNWASEGRTVVRSSPVLLPPVHGVIQLFQGFLWSFIQSKGITWK